MHILKIKTETSTLLCEIKEQNIGKKNIIIIEKNYYPFMKINKKNYIEIISLILKRGWDKITIQLKTTNVLINNILQFNG